jgi:predicted metal-dependent phosphotriesterase family hydrolase
MERAQTVTGPVDVESLGFTLPHEHLFLRMWADDGRGSIEQAADEKVLLEELRAFRELGGGCLLDLTPRGCGRDPMAVRRLAEATGLAIIMGCGWYLEPYYPPEDALARRSVNAIADQLVAEIECGMDGTDIRPGVIGEIGVGQGWLSPLEERVHRAVARAHLRTGLPIITHTQNAAAGFAQFAVFEEEGVDLRKVCVGHCDSQPYLDYCEAIAQRGSFVAFDNIGLQMGHLEDRLVHLVKTLVEHGFAEQVLLSHDVGQTSELRYFGGRGYTYLSEVFLPRLRAAGLPEAVIDQITVANPRRLVSLET